MTLAYTYNGAPLTHDIKPSGISLPQRAEGGEASFGGVAIEDFDASLVLVGHKPFIVEESACSQPRLFTGYTTQRDKGRHVQDGIIVGDDRRFDLTTACSNIVFGLRLIHGTDGNRPEETWLERLTWILGSDYLDGLISTDQTWIIANTRPMEATDYRKSTPSRVLDDLIDRSGGAYHYFAFWDPAASEVRLFFDHESETIGDCALRISNVLSDVDSSITFAPDMVAKLAREPDQAYSEVILEYGDSGASVYRALPSSATALIQRGTTISRPYTKSQATAISQADAWLRKHAYETDRITCTIQVPRVSVGLIQAGQRMSVKFSHLPGYSAFTWMRIVFCSPKPTNDIGDFYDVELELVGFKPAAPTEDLYMALFAQSSGFWRCEPEETWPDGSEVVAWSGSGDDPPSGFTGEPSEGAIIEIDHRPATACKYRGIRVLAPATVDIALQGSHSGVADGSSTSITVHIRQNGTIISQQTNTSSGVGLHSWTDEFTFALTNIDCESGDEFEVSVEFVNYGFAYFAKIPGQLNEDSHLRIDGVGGEATTGTPVVPDGAHTHTYTETTDPTVNDDAADGYVAGDVWINTTTGEAFLLVDAGVGAAEWISLGGGNDHGSLSGLADDDHPQYLLRTPGTDKVSGITPTGYVSAGNAWTDLANATDGNDATYARSATSVLAAGTYYKGLQFDLASPKALSLVYLLIDTGQDPGSSDGEWGYTVRIRYSDDGASWTTLDTVTPVWTAYTASLYDTTFMHRSNAARYWEVACVNVQPGLSNIDDIYIYEVEWSEKTTDQHMLWSDQHRDVATTAPADGDVLIFNGTTDLWEPTASWSPATTVESETTWAIAAAVGTDTELARQDHTHGTPANPVTAAALATLGAVGALLIADDHSTPIVFGDLLLTEEQDDFLYADLGG
jgi:hypothetical protein